MWVVCEIEDKCIPIQFEVSTLPKIWLLWENGELLCFWPKTNAASKIRSCADPKSDWKTYKCRLLMKGATFESYEEALEAERIAEGFSTLSAFKINSTPKRERNDSKSETDSDAEGSTKIRSSSSSSIDDAKSDSSVLYSDEEFIGNDTFEYNELIKVGGNYVLEEKNCNTNANQLDETAKFAEKKFDLNSPQSDYSTSFAVGGMLTSTILDSGDNGESVTQLHSQISKIDVMITSFVENVGKELTFLKEMVHVQSFGEKRVTTSNGLMIPLKQNGNNVSTSGIKISEVEIANEECNIGTNDDHEYDPIEVQSTSYAVTSKETEKSLKQNGNNVLTSGIEILEVRIVSGEYNVGTNAEDGPIRDATYTVPNAMNVSNATIVSNAANELMHVDRQDAPIKETTFVAPEPKIRLPINSPDHYHQTEKLFVDEEMQVDETPLEKALIAHLVPFDDEIETHYMDRTIDMVFEHKFFLEIVSWKNEVRRINIKRSNILSCWKRSFEKYFGPDDYYETFKKHFRRVKGSKRAADKAKERKLKMLNKKSMK